MKLKVRDVKFQSRARVLLTHAQRIVEGYDIPVTVRQVFYRLVAEGIITNTKEEYKRVGRILKNGRYAGLIDWNKITDETRAFYKPHSYVSIEEALEKLRQNYRRDRWEGSDYFIIVWVEKATMIGQFYPITSEYDVRLTAGRGWGSTSHVWETVRRITGAEGEDKEIRVLHFGDLDPSGWGMIDDVEDRLNEFGLGVTVEHVLLNEDDITRYDLQPSHKVLDKGGRDKLESDTRAERFRRQFGRLFQVEVEAMDPDDLTLRLKQALDKYFDPGLYQKILNQEQKEIARIRLTRSRSKNAKNQLKLWGE